MPHFFFFFYQMQYSDESKDGSKNIGFDNRQPFAFLIETCLKNKVTYWTDFFKSVPIEFKERWIKLQYTYIYFKK